MIELKSLKEMAIIKEGGQILAKIFKDLEPYIKEGISTFDISRIAEELINKYRVKPAFKGYRENSCKSSGLLCQGFKQFEGCVDGVNDGAYREDYWKG